MERLTPRRSARLRAGVALPASVAVQLAHVARAARQRLAAGGTGGVGIVFADEPARGGRQVAEALAEQLDVPLQRVDLAAIASPYVGETGKNLDRVLAKAKAAGALLWFDEADALFGRRSEVKDAHDRYANIEIAYLLQRLEAFTGLVVLTCNRKHALDSAFLRRLRFIVNFPFPLTRPDGDKG